MKWGDEGLQEVICRISHNNFLKMVDDKNSDFYLQLNDFAWMKYWQLPLVIEVNARLQREAHFMTDDLPRCCDSEITHLVLTLFSVG